MQTTAMDELAPDFDEAAAFLEALEPGASFTFQTFDDSPGKRRDLASQHHGPLAACWDALAALNRQGAGVFVCLNRTDGQGRKAANVTGVRGVFADFDEADPDRLPRLAATLANFPPSLVVESSPGKHHAYWLADGLALDDFTPLQKALAAWLGSDPKVCDLPRVARVPGFIHRKGAPFVSRVVHTGDRLAADAIRQALAPYAAREAAQQAPAPGRMDAPPYAVRALEGASGAILTAPAGARNDTLNREAFGVFGLVKAGHLAEGEARHALERAAAGAGLANDEAVATLASAWDAAAPRAIPERLTPATAARLPPATAANAPAFGFASAGELVAHLKPRAWLVRGFVEADSLSLVFGEPGHGKSFLALDWAASVATGTAWHGSPVRQGAVFVVAGEGHNGIARRLKAWELARGVKLEGAPLFVSHAAASLADWESAREVVAAVEARAKAPGQAPALIVVDTLSRNLGAADENSSADMAAFIRHLDAMRQQWQATVCVVHHSGKDSAKGARGSTVLKGAVDAEYRVAKDEAGVVCLEGTKMKDAELPGLQAFKLEGVKLPLVDDEGGDVWGAALAPVRDYQPTARGKAGRGKNQTKALAALRALYDDHRDRLARGGSDPEAAKVLIDDWRDELAADGFTRQRFHDVKASLERAGLVRLVPPYVELME